VLSHHHHLRHHHHQQQQQHFLLASSQLSQLPVSTHAAAVHCSCQQTPGHPSQLTLPPLLLLLPLPLLLLLLLQLLLSQLQ
jgi:hypothetical protein